jgi:3',5'-cyclic-AMP phosphodiesterase
MLLLNQPQARAVRIVQITDSHLFSNKESKLLGMNTEESFRCVYQLAQKEQKNPDLILVTGDVSQDGSEEAYVRMHDAMQFWGVPVYWLPGNHDHFSLMRQVVGSSQASPCFVDIGAWRLVLLNSQIERDVPGRLTSSELEFLDQSLKSAGDRYILIALHHHPVFLNSQWLDTVALLNPEDFFNIVHRYNRVRAVIWGHVHQSFESKLKDILLFSAPSTCVQFKPQSEDFALDTLAPGYRWFDLYDDGSIKSSVSRVANFHLTVDHSATGY